MLGTNYYLDIEQHKNKLRIDIAWYKNLIIEAIFGEYNRETMMYLQQEVILKEMYLKELNINNYERVSSKLVYKAIPQRSIIDIV